MYVRTSTSFSFLFFFSHTKSMIVPFIIVALLFSVPLTITPVGI